MSLSNKPFLIGLILSPLLYAFGWFLFNKPEPQILTEQAIKPPLTIDLIPTTPRVPISKESFNLISEDGSSQTVSIADFAGKPTILHFWATWCKPCVAEMPELDEFVGQVKDDVNVVVILADIKTSRSDVIKFYKSKGIKNLKIYMDEDAKFLRDIKVKALPTTIFVTSDSLEIGRVLGAVDWVSGSGQAIVDSLKS